MLYEQYFAEEYIGKLPEFSRISELFNRILEKARKDLYGYNPNNSKENKEIERILIKFFGLKKIYIWWSPDYIGNAGAYTAHVYNLTPNIMETLISRKRGRGFYDTEHVCVFGMCLHCGLLDPKFNLTGSEITALALHEIGHCFDMSPLSHVRAWQEEYIHECEDAEIDPIKNANDIIDSVIDDEGYYKDGQFLHPRTRERKYKERERLLRAYHQSTAFQYFKAGLGRFGKNLLWIISGGAAIRQLMCAKDRFSEQFADSFAVTYGFGAELISSLEKLHDKSMYLSKATSKSLMLWRDFYDAQNEIVNMMSDEHATNQARCKDCINKLKNDLNQNDYPPEMKKDIMGEIRSLEKIYSKMVNCNPEQRISFVRGWRQFCEKLFGGKPEITRILGKNQM